MRFRPFNHEPHATPGCYVALGCRLPGISLSRPTRELRLIQSRLVFEIAREALGARSGYEIEKKLMGGDFASAEPPRWWEKLNNRKLDLPSALRRQDPKALAWMGYLKHHTEAAERALSMPLWRLAPPDRVSVDAVESWLDRVKAMGCSIPDAPSRSVEDAKRYTDALSEPLLRGNAWAAINVAAYCLRLAEAHGNLPQFVLTYKAMLSRQSFQYLTAHIPIWTELAFFFESCYSTIQIKGTDSAGFVAITEELAAYGLEVEGMSLSRDQDVRYVLADQIIRPTFDCSIPSNFIFVTVWE